ncbi:MAG: hypothetical protein ABDH49_06910 [Candidatus Hydrothermales bacterium]
MEKTRDIELDEESDDSDLDEKTADKLTDEFSPANKIEELKEEIEVLKELVYKAEGVYKRAIDTKLNALKECLERAEFSELKDSSGNC